MLTLVTGGTGLLGNNVVRLLIERGQKVRVLVRATSDARPLAGLDVETVHGDVLDDESVRAAMRGVSLVIHCAAIVRIGWRDLARFERVNVEGSRRVAQAARAAGARMIHVSSVDAIGLGTRQSPADEDTPFGNSVMCPYVVTKYRAERAVLDQASQGLDARIVNPVYMVGPWDWKPSSGRMLLAVSKGVALVAPSGGNNFVDPRDVAAGILLAAERGQASRRYILGGEALSYYEAWQTMARVTGSRPPLWRQQWQPGIAASMAVGWAGDAWGAITGREPDVNTAAVRMSHQPHYYASDRAQRELGYTFRTAEAAFAAAWEWFRQHGYAKKR